MKVEEVLKRLERVRARGHGRWSALCAAHADKYPSLTLRETDDGRILLHCFAGCSVEAICAALGLTVSNLFPDPESPRLGKRKPRSRPWRFDWRQTAALLEDHALTLWLRAESVLASAKDMQTPEWTDEDFDTAVKAVSRAYTDIERSEFLEDVAFDLRLQGLREEQERYATRNRVA